VTVTGKAALKDGQIDPHWGKKNREIKEALKNARH
jgi:hypothetical protein